MAADDPNEEELDLQLEPAEADLEDEGTETDEQDSSREDQTDDRTDVVEAKDEKPEPQAERQPSRRDTRIQTLSEEARQAKADLADTRRRLDELSRQVSQPKQSGETPEQRAQRFSLMTPQEQIAESLREAEQRFEARTNALTFQSAEHADRTAFHMKAASDPLYAKWESRVEAELTRLRTEGKGNPEREILMAYMIGKAALERRSSKEGKAEVRQAQRRVASQRTRPVSSGSDTQAQRRQSGSLERRLENEFI
jgi:hypothetical protein